jgi:hypothetical protein
MKQPVADKSLSNRSGAPAPLFFEQNMISRKQEVEE